MNNSISIQIVRCIFLILAQVAIASNIDFLGYIDPYIYILFIFIFPVRENRIVFLISAFFLGLIIDLFLDSGGVHAASSVFLAYARPILLKTVFGTLHEYHSITFNNTNIGSILSYITLGTLVHHTIMFSLEVFSLSSALLILKKTLFSGLFTIVVCILIIILFSRSKK